MFFCLKRRARDEFHVAGVGVGAFIFDDTGRVAQQHSKALCSDPFLSVLKCPQVSSVSSSVSFPLRNWGATAKTQQRSKNCTGHLGQATMQEIRISRLQDSHYLLFLLLLYTLYSILFSFFFSFFSLLLPFSHSSSNFGTFDKTNDSHLLHPDKENDPLVTLVIHTSSVNNCACKSCQAFWTPAEASQKMMNAMHQPKYNTQKDSARETFQGCRTSLADNFHCFSIARTASDVHLCFVEIICTAVVFIIRSLKLERPGGAVNYGESCEAALAREIRTAKFKAEFQKWKYQAVISCDSPMFSDVLLICSRVQGGNQPRNLWAETAWRQHLTCFQRLVT